MSFTEHPLHNDLKDYISEEAFLLTELRYTLGQLHVQLGDLNASERAVSWDGQTIAQIVSDMAQYESAYQSRYVALLDRPLSGTANVKTSSGEGGFEAERARTIALLQEIEGDWPGPMLDIVRQQVADDRHHVTMIANCRRAILAGPG